jgi:4-amino-4-deoxy-L-arabinose transferase-like glycosyltransferase
MIRNWKNRELLVGIALLGIFFFLLYGISGDVLRVAGDEGIYLQGGRLVAQGQQPYRDFFAIAGPLTFWAEGALGRWGGMNLAVMRLPAILDAAFLAWAVYWFTSRYAGVFYSAGTAVAFLACEVRVRQLNVNHRWDSAALAVGAVLLALHAQRTGRRGLWAACGFLTVVAALATPSMALVALPLLYWCGRRAWRNMPVFLSGAVVAAGIAAAYLQSEQALLPLIRSMRWTGANYTQANRVFYGGLFMRGLPGVEPGGWAAVAGLPIWLLPAILPLAAILGWGWYFRQRRNRTEAPEIVPMLMVTLALVFSAWPRWTSDALLHTMALSFFLCALLFYRLTEGRQRLWFCLTVLLASVGSLANKGIAAMDYWPRETRVGTLPAALDESEFLAGLERWIQPGDSLFSYPYMPSAYYFLNARNPTRYSFLQPGMMTAEDERRAIGELEARPPRWVIYEKYPPETVLAMWPGSDPARIPMTAMNTYLQEHYHPVDTVAGPWGHVLVMEKNPQAKVP